MDVETNDLGADAQAKGLEDHLEESLTEAQTNAREEDETDLGMEIIESADAETQPLASAAVADDLVAQETTATAAAPSDKTVAHDASGFVSVAAGLPENAVVDLSPDSAAEYFYNDPTATPALLIEELSWWTTDDDIIQIALLATSDPNCILDIAFFEHKSNGKSRGSVWVLFNSVDAAAKTKAQFETIEIDNRYPVVSYSDPNVNMFRVIAKEVHAHGSMHGPQSAHAYHQPLGAYSHGSGRGMQQQQQQQQSSQMHLHHVAGPGSMPQRHLQNASGPHGLGGPRGAGMAGNAPYSSSYGHGQHHARHSGGMHAQHYTHHGLPQQPPSHYSGQPLSASSGSHQHYVQHQGYHSYSQHHGGANGPQGSVHVHRGPNHTQVHGPMGSHPHSHSQNQSGNLAHAAGGGGPAQSAGPSGMAASQSHLQAQQQHASGSYQANNPGAGMPGPTTGKLNQGATRVPLRRYPQPHNNAAIGLNSALKAQLGGTVGGGGGGGQNSTLVPSAAGMVGQNSAPQKINMSQTTAPPHVQQGAVPPSQAQSMMNQQGGSSGARLRYS